MDRVHKMQTNIVNYAYRYIDLSEAKATLSAPLYCYHFAYKSNGYPLCYSFKDLVKTGILLFKWHQKFSISAFCSTPFQCLQALTFSYFPTVSQRDLGKCQNL